MPFYEYFCMPLEKLVADELSKLDHDHNFRAPTWLRNIDTKWKQETHINTNTHAMPKNRFLDFKPHKSPKRPLASHYLVLSISLLLFCNNQHHYITLTLQSVNDDRYKVQWMQGYWWAGLSYTAILSTIQYQYNISKYWDNTIQ